jgi:hypothetical protein
MTATDAIVTDCPVFLPGSKEKVLGEWDETRAKGGILIIQPGVTIAYDDKGVGTYKSRGLGKAEFAKHAKAAEEQWEKVGVYGAFTAVSHRFIGIKTALARNNYDSRCRWVDTENTLKYFPGSKRYIPKKELTAHLDNRPSISLANSGYDEPSAPYKQIHKRLTNDGYDEAVFISEQPAIECELLEMTSGD